MECPKCKYDRYTSPIIDYDIFKEFMAESLTDRYSIKPSVAKNESETHASRAIDSMWDAFDRYIEEYIL